MWFRKIGKGKKEERHIRDNILHHDPQYNSSIVDGSSKKQSRTKIPPSSLSKTINEDQILRLMLKGDLNIETFISEKSRVINID